MFQLALFSLALAASAMAGKVKVFHSIYSVGTVDVCIGGTTVTPLYAGLESGKQSYYLDVPAGTYDIQVRPVASTVCGGEIAFQKDVDVGDATYTAIAHGAVEGFDPDLLVITDDLEADAGDAGVRFVHSCAGAPNVDVLVDDAVAFTDVPYGGLDVTGALPAGDHTIEVRVAGTTTVVFGPADLTFWADTVYSIFAYGSVDSLPLEPYVSIDNTAQTTDIRAIHGFAKAGGPAVDVWANGAPLIENFEYSDLAGYVTVPALKTFVEIYAAGTMTSVFDRTAYDLAPDARITLVAHGLTTPISLLPVSDDTTEPAAGNVKVRFVHASAGSPAVDVVIDGEVAFADFSYGEISDFAEVPAATYEISVTAAGDAETVVVTPKDLTLKTSTQVTVYALGDLESDMKDLMVKAFPVEDKPESRVLAFNSGSAAIPSALLLVASALFALAM